MNNYLCKNELSISVRKMIPNEAGQAIRIMIQSDFNGECHKERLYVDKKDLEKHLKELWPLLKAASGKVLSASISFDHIDYYDDMTEPYTTPSAYIKRGLTNPKMGYREWGSIPKDWSTEVGISFAATTRATPIMKALDVALGSLINHLDRKKLQKKLQELLSAKDPEGSFLIESNA